MKTFVINKNIKIEAEYYSTSRSWGHKAWLYLDGEEIGYKKITYLNRTWESYQFQSILDQIVRSSKRLTEAQRLEALDFIKHNGARGENDSLKTIAMVAKLGEVFGNTQKQSNDWKARMLKAGLENKGLIMPDDWDSLDEDEKTRRLDGAIAELA